MTVTLQIHRMRSRKNLGRTTLTGPGQTTTARGTGSGAIVSDMNMMNIIGIITKVSDCFIVFGIYFIRLLGYLFLEL